MTRPLLSVFFKAPIFVFSCRHRLRAPTVRRIAQQKRRGKKDGAHKITLYLVTVSWPVTFSVLLFSGAPHANVHANDYITVLKCGLYSNTDKQKKRNKNVSAFLAELKIVKNCGVTTRLGPASEINLQKPGTSARGRRATFSRLSGSG